ncbi:MAG: ABC transporter substrate-binding protein [Acidobacteriota bacterium]|nr:ABC transporter substrate-binding protein [Acidobacteriota bacterium]
MNKIKIFAFLLLLLLLESNSSTQERVIKDDLGFPFIIKSPPERIVSLAPNITEILFALGLEDKITGVTRYCDFPKEAQTKEKIGGIVDPNLEKIKSLNPDLVVAFRGNPLGILNRLRKLHCPVFVLEQGTTIESVFETIRKVGIVTQTETQAHVLIQSLEKQYTAILEAVKKTSHKPKVFVSLHGTGLWTCGKNSFLSDLITKAGGVNIAEQVDRKWLLYNKEELIHKNPEIIIILSSSETGFSRAKDWIKNEAHLESITAVASGRIYSLDENIASRHGPRIIEALRNLASILHPGEFKLK